jgi:hypothetical protein
MVVIYKGVVTETTVRLIGTSTDPDAADGYGIGAMTVFQRDRQNKEDGQ